MQTRILSMSIENEKDYNKRIFEAIHELPKVEEVSVVSSMYSINLEDMLAAIKRFKKVPTIDEVIRDNNKLIQELRRKDEIINELRWKPINEYDKSNYDWVLVKMFIKEDNFECVPIVLEKRGGNWYDRNENKIDEQIFELRYFADMQLLDKLGTKRGINDL